ERGRRGLEMLSRMQKEATVRIELLDADPVANGADGKLVALARELSVPIMTNDYGLNRVAELQGVTVLNVNDLAKAVRPVVLAAGSSSRAGVDKVIADLGGHPVLVWSLQAGQVAGCFREIVVVAPPSNLAAVLAVTQGRESVRVIAGGATRTASSWAALDAAG